MMKINWKVRLKNKAFLVSSFAFVLLMVQQGAQMFGYALPVELTDQIETIFNSVLSILVFLGIVVDPTTSNVSDSTQALTYDKPNDQ